MAKVPFTKLNISKNTEVKTFIYNGQSIEVKQYLPIQEKMSLISKVLNAAVNNNMDYYNPGLVDVYYWTEVAFTYTNIGFTDKQKEDLSKLYDLLQGNGILKMMQDQIPFQELMELRCYLDKTIELIYQYNNSAMGIMKNLQADYSNLQLDAEGIQSAIADPNNLELLKDVLEKLG